MYISLPQWAHFIHAEVLFLLKLKLPQKILAWFFKGISQATQCEGVNSLAQRQTVGGFCLKGEQQHSLFHLTWGRAALELELRTQ